MISAVELELAAAHLEAHGLVTDLVAPSLAEPQRHRRFLADLARRRGKQRACWLTVASLPRHGAVWAIFGPPARSRGAEALAIWQAVARAAWTRCGRGPELERRTARLRRDPDVRDRGTAAPPLQGASAGGDGRRRRRRLTWPHGAGWRSSPSASLRLKLPG